MEIRNLKGPRAGGAARAITQREQALKRYYANPCRCRHCGKAIPVRDGERVAEVKRRKFCDKTCSAAHNNRVRVKKSCVPPVRNGVCCLCGGDFQVAQTSRRKRCVACDDAKKVENLTKGTLFKLRRNWQSARSSIGRHARLTLKAAGTPMTCFCGYATFVEVAHVRAVMDFPDSYTVMEINKVENLRWLCPNHHKEYDAGLLKLPDCSTPQVVDDKV